MRDYFAAEIAADLVDTGVTLVGGGALLLGMAEFNLGNWDRASAEWGRASRYPKSTQAAQQWMNHLREERLRRS